ncbi:MAG: DNA-binding protein [Candidatus Methanomethylophilaceae archaeon]|jgi:predicted DNA-binding protein with PD1-like motif|nr:DNA-binding protein [Candidatus Methanomethylophilaceae archaeon]NLF33476.1 DNA-binding protein [Thermoplasmatales archaeon]
MRSTEAAAGRFFILRLMPGEILHVEIERFAAERGIKSALLTAVGGADTGSVITVGPKVPVGHAVEPLHHVLEAPHELTGTGTLFEDEEGVPLMHMHGSCGREGRSVTGCFRSGIVVWLVMEVTVTELVGGAARRLPDENGFKVLDIEG